VAFSTTEEASAATQTPFDIFASEQELSELAAAWPAERLLAVLNSLPGEKPVKKMKDPKKAAKTEEAAAPREESKTAQVVAMLQRKNGATTEEIMTTMSWQRHTVRGFMAGAMKKAGYIVESFKPEGGERTYRISK
jgi:hypothetical protein